MWRLPLARWRWHLPLTGAGNNSQITRIFEMETAHSCCLLFLWLYWAQNTLKFFPADGAVYRGKFAHWKMDFRTWALMLLLEYYCLYSRFYFGMAAFIWRIWKSVFSRIMSPPDVEFEGK